MNAGDMIEFNRKKQFKYIKPLGIGGTGDTYLFLDNTTNMYFAIKKYVPKQPEYMDEFYKRFVDEIKILFTLSHPNIVRIYNYYLYPDAKLGYLQMEYIEGTTIDKYVSYPWEKSWEDIFIETVSAFRYLESNNILHRDIRPANIMIDNNGNVKIIDFGFSKILTEDITCGESIFLNWPATEQPEEIAVESKYTGQSEIYFLGKLFHKILNDNGILSTFQFTYILEKMTKISQQERYKTFDEIEQEISLGVLSELDFTEKQKEIYQSFASALTDHIPNYINKYDPIDDIQHTLSTLAEIIRTNALEKYIQDNSLLIKAFIRGAYRYNSRRNIETSSVKNFYKFLMQLDSRKQKIVMDNIHLRLSTIPVIIEPDDDLPF